MWLCTVKAISSWVTKEIFDCFVFALLRYFIVPENLCHFHNQLDSKPKPVATWSVALFRALGSSFFILWFLIGPSWYLFSYIGCREWFGFSFTTLNREVSFFPTRAFENMTLRCDAKLDYFYLLCSSTERSNYIQFLPVLGRLAWWCGRWLHWQPNPTLESPMKRSLNM